MAKAKCIKNRRKNKNKLLTHTYTNIENNKKRRRRESREKEERKGTKKLKQRTICATFSPFHNVAISV